MSHTASLRHPLPLGIDVLPHDLPVRVFTRNLSKFPPPLVCSTPRYRWSGYLLVRSFPAPACWSTRSGPLAATYHNPHLISSLELHWHPRLVFLKTISRQL